MNNLRELAFAICLSLTIGLAYTSTAQVPTQQIAADPLQTDELVKDLSDLDQSTGLLIAAQILLQRGDLANGVSYLDKASVIAEGLSNSDLLGRCSLLKGVVAESKGDLKGAAQSWGVAAVQFDESKQFEALHEANTRKAVVQERQGLYLDAVETLKYSQTVASRENLSAILADASAQKARLHLILAQLREAKDSYMTAEQLLRPAGKANDIARLDTLNAGILNLEGKNDEAIPLLDKAFKFYVSTNNIFLAGNCRYNGALMLQKQKKYDESNSWLSDSIYYYAAGGQPGGVANALAAQGGNFLDLERPAVAEALLQQAYRIQEIGGNMMRKAEIKIALARSYQNMGVPAKVEPALSLAAEYFKATGQEERGKALIAEVRAEKKSE